MTVARRLEVNPGNPAQFAILWSNGRIDTFGGIPTIPMSRSDGDGGYPLWEGDMAVDFQVIEWLTPSGYTLDHEGLAHEWGSAPPAHPNFIPTGSPVPVPFPGRDVARALYMDPGGTGSGYCMDCYGMLNTYGSAPTLPQASDGASGLDLFRALTMQWSTKKYYLLDCFGDIWPGNGAPSVTPAADGSIPPTWPQYDRARQIVVEWSPPVGQPNKGYVLDITGKAYPFNGARQSFGGPILPEGFIPLAPIPQSAPPPITPPDQTPPPPTDSNPPPFTPILVSSVGIDGMTLNHIQASATLDSNGHGYLDFPSVPFSQVTGVWINGPNPPVSGYWPPQWIEPLNFSSYTRCVVWGNAGQSFTVVVAYFS